MKKLKSNVLVLAFILLGVQNMSAQAPVWNVNESSFQYSMTLSGVTMINSVEATDTSDRISAWKGTELRGVAKPFYLSTTNRYYFFLTIYSNGGTENIVFKFYDKSSNSIIALDNQETFVSDKLEGGFSDPYVFHNKHYFKFSSFSFSGIAQTPTIDTVQRRITLTTAGNQDADLIANYVFNGAKSIKVNGVTQVSGVTVNDFYLPVTYTVTTITNEVQVWTVEVSGLVSSLQKSLADASMVLYPNPARNKVQWDDGFRIEKAELSDVFGNKWPITPEANTIDVLPLANGMYYLTLHSGSGVIVRSFIKE